jgi:hypothetical protein
MLVATGVQVASSNMANSELHEDMVVISAQAGVKIGLYAPMSDDELRSAVIAKATELGIRLKPSQIDVRRTGEADKQVIFLTADYDARINLLLFSFPIHLQTTSQKQP